MTRRPWVAAVVAVVLLAPWAALASGPEGDADAASGDQVDAAGTFSRSLTGIRWHAIKLAISGCTNLAGTLRYTVTSFNTEAPQQGFVAFSGTDSLLFGLHQHVVDGRAYTATVVNGAKDVDSTFGLNRFAPPTFMLISASGGCSITETLVYWSSGPTNVQVSMSWTTGSVIVTDSWGTTGTFAYTKADMGGWQARTGPNCNPSCPVTSQWVGAGALMTKNVPATNRLIGAFLPDPGAPQEDCTPSGNGEWSCNNVEPDTAVVQQSSWTSPGPSPRTRVLAPVVDERIFVIGRPLETGTWKFSTTADVDLNPMYAALSGVDVLLP